MSTRHKAEKTKLALVDSLHSREVDFLAVNLYKQLRDETWGLKILLSPSSDEAKICTLAATHGSPIQTRRLPECFEGGTFLDTDALELILAVEADTLEVVAQLLWLLPHFGIAKIRVKIAGQPLDVSTPMLDAVGDEIRRNLETFRQKLVSPAEHLKRRQEEAARRNRRLAKVLAASNA
jgi:hypothetical protein